MLFSEKSWRGTWSSAARSRVLVLEVIFDGVRELSKVLEEPKREPTANFVTLELAGQVVDDAIEGRVGRDGDSRKRLEACRAVDVDLDPGAVEGIIRGGGRSMEYQNRQMAEERIVGIVKSDMLMGERQLLGDTNHGHFNGPVAWLLRFGDSSKVIPEQSFFGRGQAATDETVERWREGEGVWFRLDSSAKV